MPILLAAYHVPGRLYLGGIWRGDCTFPAEDNSWRAPDQRARTGEADSQARNQGQPQEPLPPQRRACPDRTARFETGGSDLRGMRRFARGTHYVRRTSGSFAAASYG